MSKRKYKDIFCEKCKEKIMTIEHNPLYGRYYPVGNNYIQVSKHRFDEDVCFFGELPENKGREFNHYYHFKCWDLPIPDSFGKRIDLKEK